MDSCCVTIARNQQRHVLQVVLAVNAPMVCVEFGAGLFFRSTALLGDSLDMLGTGLSWGTKGTGAGEFDVPHRNAIEARGKTSVCRRSISPVVRGRKVPTARHLCPVNDVIPLLGRTPWGAAPLAATVVPRGETPAPCRHVDPTLRKFRKEALEEAREKPAAEMPALVLQARGGRTGVRHPVDHDVGQELILRVHNLDVAVVIAPHVELLDDPCGKPHG